MSPSTILHIVILYPVHFCISLHTLPSLRISASSVSLLSLSSYPCKADRSIDDVTSSDIDCLIIPGGFAPDYWRRSDKYKKLTKDALEEGKPVAAICHGKFFQLSPSLPLSFLYHFFLILGSISSYVLCDPISPYPVYYIHVCRPLVTRLCWCP